MKIFFPILFVLLLSAFAFATIYENPDDADLALDKVLDETTHYALKKYNIEAVGTGIGFPNGNLRMMGLSFQINHQLAKDSAKMMLLDIATFMKDKVNANSALIKRIENPPFRISNLELRLFFTDDKGDSPVHPDFVVISIIDGEFNTKTKESRDTSKYFSWTVERIESD